MLKKILIGVAVVLVGLVAFIASRPSSFRVERSATIAAPAEVVFAMINDFHQWQAWSPWEKLDPSMKKTLDGPAAGVGAIYYWNGNDQVGEGRMTVTESRPNERITIKLEFLKPFASTSNIEFTVAPSGSDVKLTWVMGGHNDFMGKVFSTFMDADSMIGKDLEKGLANLKAGAEAEAKRRADEAAKKAAAEAEAAKKAAEAAAANSPANTQ